MRGQKRKWLAGLFVLVLVIAGCGGRKNEQAVQKMESEPVQETEQKEETETLENQSERIVCWGDSLTCGSGGNGVTYPEILAEKTGLSVYNYGVLGETAKQIAIRMGLYRMTVPAFVIPKDTTPVEVQLLSQGEDPIMLRLGDVGLNPCEIAGVEGTLSYNYNDGKYYFTRKVAGEEVAVSDGTPVMIAAEKTIDPNDIVILFAGSNDRPTKDTVADLIKTEQEIIDYLGSSKYIVVGITSKGMVPEVEEANKALEEAFGTHFLDIRTYMLTHGLEDAGITPTEQDLADIANGEIPSSLRVDVVHGTADFYTILGEQLYEKMRSNGYIR